MERLKIEIEGDLPDDNKYAILAAAQAGAKELAARLSEAHGLVLTASARPLRVNASKGSPAIVQAPTVAPEPVTAVLSDINPTALLGPNRRHAAGD